jgi:hypothetical protein
MFLPATTNPTTTDADANAVNALLANAGTLYVGRYLEALKVPETGGTPVVLSRSPTADKGRPPGPSCSIRRTSTRPRSRTGPSRARRSTACRTASSRIT